MHEEISTRGCINYLRVATFLRLEEGTKAAAEYQKILDHRGVAHGVASLDVSYNSSPKQRRSNPTLTALAASILAKRRSLLRRPRSGEQAKRNYHLASLVCWSVD